MSDEVSTAGLTAGRNYYAPHDGLSSQTDILSRRAVFTEAYAVIPRGVEVVAGNFMWLRAFCPQACCTGGPSPFCYLLYKDVNRHPRLRLGGA